MTVRVPRGASFRVPFTCECGRERAVFAAGIDPSRSLDDRWRDAGPCSDCRRPTSWRILTHKTEYEVEVTHGVPMVE